MKQREWTPNPVSIADQLVNDFRNSSEDGSGEMDAIGTIESWRSIARDHGEDFTDDDWLALVIELARRAATA